MPASRLLSRLSAAVVAVSLLGCNRLQSAPTTAGDGLVVASDTTLHRVSLADVLRYRRFESLSLSPDGSQVAYVLREPNVARDVNDLVLYVQPVPDPASVTAPVRGRALLRTQGSGFEFQQIQVRWLGNGRGFLVLHQPTSEARPILSRVELASGRARTVFRDDFYVREFSADASGDRIAIAGLVPDSVPPNRFASKRGVLITPDDYLADARAEAENERRLSPESYGRPELRLIQPRGRSITVIRSRARGVHLSPDGRRLLFSARAKDAGVRLPESWRRDPRFASPEANPEVAVSMAVPEDLPSPRRSADSSLGWPTNVAFDAPDATPLMWSDDGSAYLIRARNPLGRPATTIPPLGSQDGSQLWAVDAATGVTSLVMDRAEAGSFNHSRRAVSFDQRASRVIVTYPRGQLLIQRRATGSDRRAAWTTERTVQTNPGVIRGSEQRTEASERYVVGVGSTTMVPPDLYVMNLASGARKTFTEINPELRFQTLGKVETIEWADNNTKYMGHIVYPVDYKPGTKYPCAIFGKSWDKYSFIYEDQDGYRAGNFPAQLFAANGFVVFMSANPDGPSDIDKPGASQIHRRYYGARRQLDQRGLIDPAKCGVRGFSHTGYEVSFLVANPGPSPQWAAAVSVDGFCACYVRAMASRASGVRGELRNEGTSYGDIDRPSLDDNLPLFLSRAPAWNARRVRTPVLLDYHGSTTMRSAEMYSNLYARGKPVEYVWFVDGAHTLNLPSEREASHQRTLDWFRFWLTGEERASVPDDPERYVRWRKLRDLHVQNEKWIALGKDPGKEYYATGR